MKLIPYIHFGGNAEDAINFYKKALGVEEVKIQRYGETPMPVDEDYKNKIIHARLIFDGDNILMISDAFKGQPVSTNGNVQLSVDINDIDNLEKIFNAMAEGGQITMPLQDTFWEAKFGMLKDKFGVGWMFNCEKK
ncbi:MAG: VOC family protein [Chitinophagaceae bacterium]